MRGYDGSAGEAAHGFDLHAVTPDDAPNVVHDSRPTVAGQDPDVVDRLGVGGKHVIFRPRLQLFASRDGRRNWARAIAMMRHEFGGHPYGPDRRVAAIRRTSRVGRFEALPEKVPVE